MDFLFYENKITLSDNSGNILAEVTFPDTDAHTVAINHTYVDDSLRGQGIAGQLMEAAAKHLRGQHKKVVLTCSYALKWFEQHPEYHDLIK